MTTLSHDPKNPSDFFFKTTRRIDKEKQIEMIFCPDFEKMKNTESRFF